MIEIVALVIVGLVLLAKAGKSAPRRYSRWFFPRVTSALGLSTLADQDVLIGSELGPVAGRTYIASARLTWSYRDFTSGENPVIFGLAHSDYTAAEIEEFIEATNSWSTTDKIAMEQSKRQIRIVGQFEANAAVQFNNGRPVKTKLGFTVEDQSGILFWAYNDSGAVLTTGGVVSINGNFNCKKV